MKTRPLLRISIFLFMIYVFTPICVAEDASSVWTFVVMGDTRDKVFNTKTGISPDLGKLSEAIAKEKPDLVIHTGDLCNGYYTPENSPVHKKFNGMFQNWKAAVKLIYDYKNKKGIPIYPIRGNHEDGSLATNKKLKKAYEEEFGSLMPQNGPDNEKGLTYYFDHKGAKFIGLDEYNKGKKEIVRGYVNLKWLADVLAKDKKPFTFVYCHTPAYKVGNYHESPFPNLYTHLEHRNALWATLRKANVVAFFCGHIHFYSRGTIDGIEQIVVGDGGSDMVTFNKKNVDKAVQINFPKNHVKAADMKTGYLLMTINEPDGKVNGVQKLWNEKSGKWETGDTFTLKVNK